MECYIHVVDLVTGHLKALDRLSENPGVVTYNLGTGQGYSVLEMISAFEKASGKKVPYSTCAPSRYKDFACIERKYESMLQYWSSGNRTRDIAKRGQHEKQEFL